MIQEISDSLILHWNYRGYSCLPEELCSCGSHVSELYLKYNNITYLPDWIESLTNLTNIYLQANYLTELPDSIRYLGNLEILDVSHNRLAAVPSAVGSLTKLKKLVLTGNKIAILPDAIGQLTNLTSLQLSNNCLKELPYALNRNRNLRELFIDCNRLAFLPNYLTRLPHLQTLSVCSNRLHFLPNLPFASLQRFYCDGNTQLGHIPYPLACQWSRTPSNPLATLNTLHISCHGCQFISDGDHLARVNWLSHFPADFDLSSGPTSTPASLLELSLRSIISATFEPPVAIQHDRRSNLHVFTPRLERSENHHSFLGRLLLFHMDYDDWVARLPLPFTLINLLCNGPRAWCFYCMSSIFSSAHVAILPKILVQHSGQAVQLQRVLCPLLFCTPWCLQRTVQTYGEETKALLESRLDWRINRVD